VAGTRTGFFFSVQSRSRRRLAAWQSSVFFFWGGVYISYLAYVADLWFFFFLGGGSINPI